MNNKPQTPRSYSQLAIWRVGMGYTIKEIARALGVSRITWIRYERTDIYPAMLYPAMCDLAPKEGRADEPPK